jgi:hypothetical protein
MATEWSHRFSNLLNTLHSLESAWSQAKLEGADIGNIERAIQDLVSRMTDEELDAYGEYEQERLRQAQDKIKKYSQLLAELEAEMARRRAK